MSLAEFVASKGLDAAGDRKLRADLVFGPVRVGDTVIVLVSTGQPGTSADTGNAADGDVGTVEGTGPCEMRRG